MSDNSKRMPPWIELSYNEWHELIEKISKVRNYEMNIFDLVKTNGDLYRAIQQLGTLFKELADQHDDSFETRFEKLKEIKTESGFITIWSMYEIEDLDEPHRFTQSKEICINEIVVDIKGNTWYDLWAATDEAVEQSGDFDHIFIEGFHIKKNGQLVPMLGS